MKIILITGRRMKNLQPIPLFDIARYPIEVSAVTAKI